MHVKVASNHKITYLQLHLQKMRKICQKLLLLKLFSFFPFVFPVFLLYSSPFLLTQEAGEKTMNIRESHSAWSHPAHCHTSTLSFIPGCPDLNDSHDVFGILMGKFVGIWVCFSVVIVTSIGCSTLESRAWFLYYIWILDLRLCLPFSNC